MTCSGGAALRVTLFCLLTGCVAASASGQRTISVPGNAASIQAGIDAAANGDTVLVAPGTYTENINFSGKAITVTSSGGAAVTIIDGNANGVVVTFSSGEGRQSVIHGFTIKGGALPANPSVTATSDGIFVNNANPTITNNVITQNRGYGIEVNFGSAYISGNTITDTSTRYPPDQDYGCDYDDGDGVYIEGTSNTITAPAVVDHNTIEHNVGHCLGGGIGLYAAPPTTVISNNIIANNQSLGEGGGLFTTNGSVSLYQNLIYNNVSGEAGGGVYLSAGSEINQATGPLNVFLVNNTIYGNTIQLNPDIYDAWADGSQVALPGYVSQIGLFNNLIIANDSYAAIACWATYQYLSGAPPVVVNSDVLNTGGAAYGGWCTSPADSTGNISADPKFKNPSSGDFHLQAGSPAVDAGFNAAPGLLATDLDGKPRIQNATGASAPMVDMGTYEAAGAAESRLSSQTTLTVQPETIFYGQPISLSATVSDSSSSPIPPGIVNFMDDWSVIQRSPLNNSGVATGSTSSLAVGPHWLVASFGGNTAYRPGISAPAEVDVNGFTTSTSISFSANPIHYGQPVTLSATVTLGSGNPTGTGMPTGNIAFYTSLVPNLLATVPLNANGIGTYTTSSFPSGTTYVQAIYQPTGGFLTSNSLNLPLQILAPPFAISSTAVIVSAGATSGNQSTIAVTPSGIFTGNVALTAAITSSPAGATDLPTLSFGTTGNVSITTAAAGTATLTVTTVAPKGCSETAKAPRVHSWWFPGDMALACIFLFVRPRRGCWQRWLAMLFLLAGLTSGAMGCGGGGGGGGTCTAVMSGTTPGHYVITVTGVSGAATANTSVSLTVQ